MQYEEFYFISRHNRVNPENSFNLLKKSKIFQEMKLDLACALLNKNRAPLSVSIICLAHSGHTIGVASFA